MERKRLWRISWWKIPQDLVEEKLVVDVDVADEEVNHQAL